jgi:CubicO group peptidase (beta-lactamase class C family)
MNSRILRSPAGSLAVIALLACVASAGAFAAESADELVGLWKAHRWFGPAAHGPLVLERSGETWTADFLGARWPVRVEGTELSFALPGGEGSLRARLARGAQQTIGHWTAPRSAVNGFFFAVPVALEPDGPNRLRGVVEPREDDFRIFLMITRRADGSIGAFIRNPERNIGVIYDVDRLERAGSAVRLIGHDQGRKDVPESVLLSGTYDAENAILTLAMPRFGGSFDFQRDADHSEFYPRGRNPGRYVYRQPPARDDGWPTASLDEVNISRAGIEKFIQMLLDMPIEAVATPEVQGILVARHGKLVLEEYFHGEHRDKLHDTRSAAKSLTTTLVGAAMQAGVRLELSSPVYRVMNGGSFPADLEPRKRAMTLEHLLTMSSYCDDGDPAAPGNESTILDQTEQPDYYKIALPLPMAFDPGEVAIYCSINPNLALGVLNRATGENAMDTFDRLLGKPMQISRYAWLLDPAGNPYGGGSVQFLPRDFMKLGQLMLDGGTWHGKRILSREFVARASAPLRDLNRIQYGFLWWNIEYPYKDRTLRAYFAGGNGGQSVMVVPELDLVIATYGGSYASRVALHIQQDLAPNYILPAVREKGDDPNAPVIQRDFVTPYGRAPRTSPGSGNARAGTRDFPAELLLLPAAQ